MLGVWVGRCQLTVSLYKLSFLFTPAAYRVASRQHRLDNEVLEVSLYPSPNQQLEPACTVSVRNFHIPSTTEDNLRHYFENPRSGGGEVIGVTVHSRKVKEPIAYVCFRRAQGITYHKILIYMFNYGDLLYGSA